MKLPDPPMSTSLSRATSFVPAVARLGRGLLLLGLLLGVPWALTVFVPIPVPGLSAVREHAAGWWQAPATLLDDVGGLLQHPMTDTVILRLLAVAAWLLWTAFVLCVLTETVALLSGVQVPTLPGLGGLQGAASWLLTGTLAGLLASSAMVNHSAPPVVTRPVTLTANHTSVTSHVEEERLVYVVKPGDWLGPIAHRFLGDYHDYGRLQQANQYLIPHDAGPEGPDHIEAGWRLRLPAGARDRGPEQHATGAAHRPIENRGGLPSTTEPADPDSNPGDGPTGVAVSPSRTPEASPTGASTSAPVQAPTTEDQAEGHGEDDVAESEHDQDGVRVGDGWISWPLAVSLAAVAGLVWLTRRRLYRYTEPFGYPELGDEDDEPETLRPEPDDEEIFRPGADPIDDGDAAPSAPDGDGQTPLFWATRDRASHRRRNHILRPGRGFDDGEDPDADLQPIPAVLNRIRVQVRAHADAITASSPTAVPAPASPVPGPPAVHAQTPQPDPLTATSLGAGELSGLAGLARTGGTLPPVGPTELQLAGLPAVPPEGLGLEGPGSADAARALLVAALSAGGTDDPDAAGLVVTTFDTLNHLLGGPAVIDVAGLPRLYVAADLDAALSVLDEELLTRRRTLDEHDATDLDRLREDQPWSAPMPPVLLLAHTPPANAGGVRARLSTSLHLGEPLHIRGVLLGGWPRGQTLTVDAAGHVKLLSPEVGPGQPPAGSAGPERVAVLGIAQTLDLLAVLIETQTEIRPPQSLPPLPVPPAVVETAGLSASPSNGQSGTQPGDPQVAELPEQNGAASLLAPHRAPPPAAPAGERVRARVLGAPMILDRDGRAVPGLRTGATHLLVILAVHRDGQQLMDIMEKIWPDATTRRAAQRLSTEVANLRRTVRTALGRTDDRTPETNAVINTGSFYRLNHELLDVDAWQLTDLITAAKNTSSADRRIEHLREAIDIYRGQLADGRDYPWSDVARHQLHRDVIRAHLHLAELIVSPDQSGNEGWAAQEEAARLVGQAADLDPVSEDLAKRSIRAHAAAGDADAVRSRLRVLRAALDEIDQEPTGETLALAANITIARRSNDASHSRA